MQDELQLIKQLNDRVTELAKLVDDLIRDKKLFVMFLDVLKDENPDLFYKFYRKCEQSFLKPSEK